MSKPLVPYNPSDITPSPAGALTAYEAPALEASGGQSATQQVRRILNALNRYKWMILAIAAAGTAGGYVATRLLKPQYETSATIFIQTPNRGQGGPIQASGLLQNNNWVDLLKSYAVLDPVVLKLHLYVTPESPADEPVFEGFTLDSTFAGGPFELAVDGPGRRWTLKRTIRGAGIDDSGFVGDSVGRKFGFLWAPTARALGKDRTIKFRISQPRDASSQLRDNLVTRLPEGGNFLRVSLAGRDRRRIAATLNALGDEFVEQAAALKRDKLNELVTTIDSQLTTASTRLRDAEGSLQGFRVNTITLPSETAPVAPGITLTQNSALGTFFSLKQELDQTRRDRKDLERVLRDAIAGELAVDAFKTIPAVQAATDLGRVLESLSVTEAELRTARVRYTDENKIVKDLLDRITELRQQTIPAYANALIRRLKAKEDDLDQRINGTGSELRSMPTRTITESRLTRDVQSAEALYRNLQNRYDEARLAAMSAIPDVTFFDRAVAPVRPTKNRSWQILMIAIFGSLGLGVGLAILFDRLDPRFRYPEQAMAELGLSILGAVPALGRRNRTKQETAAATEAFRSIRLNITYSLPDGEPIRLTISSPSPGDGKSTVAANLALSFAIAGYRTIIIDADTRRGMLHREFGVDRRPGLIDYLSGGAGLDAILRPTTHANLTLIPRGIGLPDQAPELLSSARMADLLAELGRRAEVIIVDTPPLSAGVDPFVLGTLTRNMALVLRAGETDREATEARLQVLGRLPVRLLGAIMNDVRADGGFYRYYGYSYGYIADDEPEQITKGSGPTRPSEEVSGSR